MNVNRMIFRLLLGAVLVLAAGEILSMEAPENANERLLSAVKSGDLIQAQEALTAGARSTVTQGLRQLQPIHLAATSGNVELIQLLIRYGTPIDAKDVYGRTALHFAAQAGHGYVVRWLVEHGANIDAQRDINGRIARPVQEEGASKLSMQIGKWLVEHGASVKGARIKHIRNIFKAEPLLHAIIFEQEGEAEKKLKELFFIGESPNGECTLHHQELLNEALMLAAARPGQINVIAIILSKFFHLLDASSLRQAMTRATLIGNKEALTRLLGVLTKEIVVRNGQEAAWKEAFEKAIFMAAASRQQAILKALLDKDFKLGLNLSVVPAITFIEQLLRSTHNNQVERDAYQAVHAILKDARTTRYVEELWTLSTGYLQKLPIEVMMLIFSYYLHQGRKEF